MGVKLAKATKRAWEDLQIKAGGQRQTQSSFNSVFLTQAPTPYLNFLNMLKPYIDVATATDNTYSQNEAMAVLNVARKIVLGERPYFEGDEAVTAFLNDVWTKGVKFRSVLSSAVNNLLISGTTVLKLSIDSVGRIFPKSYRADEVIFAVDGEDNIKDVFFYCGAFGFEINPTTVSNYYYLVERRYYTPEGVAVTVNKVLIGSDVNGKANLSNIYGNGIAFENLPIQVKKELMKIGITTLNKEVPLPFTDGLGAYLIKLTATNALSSSIPYGTPLLYGSLPILQSLDFLTVKNDIDIQFSRAMVITPKELMPIDGLRFTPTNADGTYQPQQVEGMMRSSFLKGQRSTFQADGDLFEAIAPPNADGTYQPPQFIQPSLKAEENRYSLETLETKLAINCGFSPTSIFPNLADNSPKTATEVTAEENLTRATIHDIHEQMIPPIEALAQEVLRLEGEEMGKQHIVFKMSDYIGNKLQSDDNIRQNYQAGLMSKSKAIQQIGGLTTKETQDDLLEIEEEEKSKRQAEWQGLGLGEYNDSDYFNEEGEKKEGINGDRAEASGRGDTGRGDEVNDTEDGDKRQFKQHSTQDAK